MFGLFLYLPVLVFMQGYKEKMSLHMSDIVFGTRNMLIRILLPCHGASIEAVCLSDSRVHQTLHRSQLVTEARQSSLSQRLAGEGYEGNHNIMDTKLRAQNENLKKNKTYMFLKSDDVKFKCGRTIRIFFN